MEEDEDQIKIYTLTNSGYSLCYYITQFFSKFQTVC